jgi:hypothetical protein
MYSLTRLLRHPDGAESAGAPAADNPPPETQPTPPESPAIVERQSRRGAKTPREIELERRIAELEDVNQNLKTVLHSPAPAPAAPARKPAKSCTDEIQAWLAGED